MIQSFVEQHFGILQISIAFGTGLLSLLISNIRIVHFICSFSATALIAISTFGYFQNITNKTYTFGGWKSPYGISHYIDHINLPILVFFNLLIGFFCFFGFKFVQREILAFIKKEWQHVFFALLFFAHTGYLGIACTADIFNLYVFIEISSLSTYALVATARNQMSSVVSLDYLVIGTIGATLILIAIGLIFMNTGSLNMFDVQNIIKSSATSKTIIIASIFFLVGIMLKLAFFPLHLWMIRVYRYAPAVIIMYTAPIASLSGVYSLIRFLDFTIPNYDIVYLSLFNNIIFPVSILALFSCSILAMFTKNIKQLVAYSAGSSVAYIMLLIGTDFSRHLLTIFIFIDALNKLSLFYIIANIENKTSSDNLEESVLIKRSSVFKITCALTLISNAGLPISGMFLLKMHIVEYFISHKLYVFVFVVIVNSVLALFYNLRMLKSIFFGTSATGEIEIKQKFGMVVVLITQLLTMFFIDI